ncbi:helix-turn-helix domain-containing protein [Flavobacterium sp. WW92]|uniref:helix-turn-helix domain-containing protein n=1 Tax=unclassified Flavobacterium TaxID=196869 RepID=UPI0022252796|nr:MULTISPECIES: helix-turn-helix domain-containing protein [unclassified Flavobacterium]WDO12298.1 helix-turn-helix domain-containing protein [Flavobacterium sp. WW92]
MSSNLSVPKICEFCKNRFTAKTFKTRFCSHTCNRKAYKANGRQKKIEKVMVETENSANHDLHTIKAMEFLNVGQASVLLGISRRTIYRLVNKGCLNIGKFGSRTVLKKSDLESFFELPAEVQLFTPVKEFPGLNNCYTISEIQQRHGISPAALYNLLQRYGIAKYAVGRYTYVAKEEIHSIFNADGL